MSVIDGRPGVAAASALVSDLKEITNKTAQLLARAIREKRSDTALKALARLE